MLFQRLGVIGIFLILIYTSYRKNRMPLPVATRQLAATMQVALLPLNSLLLSPTPLEGGVLFGWCQRKDNHDLYKRYNLAFWFSVDDLVVFWIDFARPRR
jgi:hypothetical protein